MILTWDKPEKIMTAEQWQQISADGAPPGVYTPNMSRDDMARWKARLIRGSSPRVEIRKTVTGPERPAKPGTTWPVRHAAQILIIVDAATVRISANGTIDMTTTEFSDELIQAVTEARVILAGTRPGTEESRPEP